MLERLKVNSAALGGCVVEKFDELITLPWPLMFAFFCVCTLLLFKGKAIRASLPFRMFEFLSNDCILLKLMLFFKSLTPASCALISPLLIASISVWRYEVFD